MTQKHVATEDSTIHFDNQSGPPDLLAVGDLPIGHMVFTQTLSNNCKIDGKKIATTAVSYTWSIATNQCPFTSTLYDFVAGSGSINATAVNTEANNGKVHRVEDSGNCVGSWKLKASPYTVVNCSCNSEINDAKQDVVEAE